jgi:4-amino-4-deoxy-L-arabinose transferase-like glycosyltransferase
MNFSIGSKTILQVLHVLSWIIFIGLCMEAGGIIFNAVYALNKPIVAAHFWNNTDLSALYAHDKGHFMVQTFLISIVAIMKALLFYLIIKLFYDKKFSIEKPFSKDVTRMVFLMGWLCLGAGFFSGYASGYATFIEKQGVAMPDIEKLRVGGADVWIFMAVALFVVGQVLKKGIELQTENELTV